ncbi:MAG: polysaccharide deacetylase family protein [Clostridia bacterium]|nr:polysaccharide deacetylase family protein [Clostridia bacterium]
MVKPLYKYGKKRVITFSFDDGREQDEKLIPLLNKYSLKATFNLNGGRCRNDRFAKVTENGKFWVGSSELRDLYHGHEIASHSFLHKKINEMSDEELEEDTIKDIEALKKAFGVEIRGYATPNGIRDKRMPAILKKHGICYERFTCRVDTDTPFALPKDFLWWQPNPHFSYYAKDEGKKMIEDFFCTNEDLPCLYIWGHSYELELLDCKGSERWNGITDRYAYLEGLFENVAKRDDVWYATNIEIYDYITNLRRTRYDDTYIDNPTDIPIYFEINGKVIAAPPHSRFGV